MTALAVVNPFVPFLAAGAALSGGKIYIGEPSKDPISFPVAVYWDEALSIAAMQPLQTSGGYIWRNGAPGRPYVDGDCSILVLDANDQQIFYSATSGGLLVSAFAKTLLDDADAAAARTTLGIGSASEAGAGLVELATAAEVQAGTDAARAISPQALRAGALVRGTTVTASGVAIDFNSIPSWAKRITIPYAGLSTNGTSVPIVQIGDSGGIEAAGYLGAASQLTNTGTVNAANFTTGFGVMASFSAATVIHGTVTLTLLDAATNTWVATVNGGQSNNLATFQGGGSKSLSATLDRVRLTTVGGTDTFDAGSVNILYE